MVDYGTPHVAGYSYDGKIAGMIMIYEAFCKHFGIKPRFGIHDFLPPPQVERIVINEGEINPLFSAVNMLYDIKIDDAQFRQIKNEPAEKRGAYFDNMRKNYYCRREFQNTKLRIKDEKLKTIFAGLGFKVD
jgi:erythronate-4-phosphate dehydrogenase